MTAVEMYHDCGGGVSLPQWRCVTTAVEMCYDCGGVGTDGNYACNT